jgi:hypothetical protein
VKFTAAGFRVERRRRRCPIMGQEPIDANLVDHGVQATPPPIRLHDLRDLWPPRVPSGSVTPECRRRSTTPPIASAVPTANSPTWSPTTTRAPTRVPPRRCCRRLSDPWPSHEGTPPVDRRVIAIVGPDTSGSERGPRFSEIRVRSRRRRSGIVFVFSDCAERVRCAREPASRHCKDRRWDGGQTPAGSDWTSRCPVRS